MIQTKEKFGIERLDATIKDNWNRMFLSAEALRFMQHAMSRDRRIYALYLTQVYHYAFHTPRNLALAGSNLFNQDIRLMHHCFEHAMEETGHELMALNDLRALGVNIIDPVTDMPPVLPATDSMIGYVKHLATGANPYMILGYSYWIEQPYGYIHDFMQTLKHNMQLTDGQMSFYLNHRHIDEKHGADIQHVIEKVCTREDQVQALEQVIRTTMQCTFRMLLEIIEEFENLNDATSKYSIVNSITTTL